MSSDASEFPIGEDIRRLCRQIDNEGREYWWIKPHIAASFETGGYHILPRHFYSPVADPETAARTDFEYAHYPLENLIFNEGEALQFLERISGFSEELMHQFPQVKALDPGFYWDNPFLGGLDAAALYTAVRSTQPQQVVEVGSGFSSHVSLRALEANGKGTLTCIEPYPTAKLLEISGRIRILECPVQKASSEIFKSLGSGDILFIDSSHVSCLGSDVNFEILEILPRLAKGVIVHFHDIFLPFEYPQDWVTNRRWQWNEQYLLYAFLRMNDSYEIWMPNNYMIQSHPAVVLAALPFLNEQSIPGSSMWMRKIR